MCQYHPFYMVDYQKLLRLARLPRLYRLLRVLRLIKMFRILKYSKIVKKMLDRFKVNAAMMRIVYIVISAMFLVHLMACLWFLVAKLDDFNPDTWVIRMNV